jgi:hypothetical protein
LYEAWARAFADRDLDAAVGLYSPDCTLESPLVNNLLGREEGVVSGREDLRRFFKIIFDSTPSLKKRHRTNFHTDGRVMTWEYPRITPWGEQPEMTEVMELKDGLIHCHRIYWGWKSTQLLQKDQYRTSKA